MLLNFYTPTVEYKENFFLKGAPSKTKAKRNKSCHGGEELGSCCS